jgi:regulator of cell morphogenesis and NO signaling
MDLTQINKLTVGEIVANDFRASSIFKNAGIDFCCGGKQSLEEACMEKDVSKEDLTSQLEDLQKEPQSNSHNFKEWEPGFLCDYIVNTHHKFVEKNLPELVFYTNKIASVHGDHHPELIEVARLFNDINDELIPHMKNEEEILFPAIKEVVLTNSSEAKKAIVTEITRMLGEHDAAGKAMDKINQITKSYLVPEDGCATYQVSFKMLQQFEDDLHVHIHLENNILFPRALELAS